MLLVAFTKQNKALIKMKQQKGCSLIKLGYLFFYPQIAIYTFSFFNQYYRIYEKGIQSYPVTVIHFPEPITMKAVNDAIGCDCQSKAHHRVH